jgi:hypothetical protein
MAIIWVGTGRFQAPAPPVLDTYSGAVAAYSLRQLRSGVTSVVRVRRSSDNTESDFTATEVSDGTLVSWVGAANNGFVQTWYDQSGNNKNAVQTITANQPQIVSSGALILEGGKPSLQFDGINDFLDVNSITSIVYFFSVLKTNTGLSGLGFLIGNRSSNNPFFAFGNVTSAFANETYTVSVDGSRYFYTTHTLQNVYNLITTDMSGKNVFVNGASRTTGALGTVTFNAGFNIGGRNNTASLTYNGTMQEHIIYDATQDSVRTDIESNINAHFNIY